MRAFLIASLLLVPILVTCGEVLAVEPDAPAVAGSGVGRSADSSGPTRLAPVPVPTPDGPAYRSGLISNVAVVYQNGDEHAENVELHLLPSKETLLAFRAGGTGQAETGSARIRIFSFDPQSYAGQLKSEVAPPAGDPPRGIRDPKLFQWNGALRLGAISRVAGFPIRDLLADTHTVIATSRDGARSFGATAAIHFKLTDKQWGLWRYTTRHHGPLGLIQTLYATGYDDGDTETAYFASIDGGKSFTRLGSVLNAPDQVPSEAELNFLGPDESIAVSLVRLDNQGLQEDGQTAICVKRGSWLGFFGDFDCQRRLEQRLDGPSRIFEVDGRRFVIARKHLACTRKRTALYEIRGDLANPSSPIRLFEVAELPSNGDTAYAAVSPVPGHPDRFVAAWYSTPLGADIPWLPAQFGPTWILAATLDFRHYRPDLAVPAAPDAPCPSAPLPSASPVDVEGGFLLSIAPTFFPDLPAFFLAQAATDGSQLIVGLQAIDQNVFIGSGTPVPVGDPFQATATVDGSGHFLLDFGNPTIPFAAYPLGTTGPADGVDFLLQGFKLEGVTRDTDTLCGNVAGDVLIQGPGLIPPNTRLLFEGSTFGAARDGVVTSCGAP